MGTIHRREESVSMLTTLFLSVVTTVFLFQTLLENYIYASSYLDEALAALFVGFFVLYLLIDMEIRSDDLIICVMVVLTAAAGLYGNMRFGIQENRTAILLDIVSHFKFAAIYLGTAAVVRVRRIDWRGVIRVPAILAKIYITILFSFGVLNLLTDIGMHAEYRYGLRTYAFIFGTPGIVTNTVLYIMMLLLMESAVCGDRSNRWFLLMAIATLLFVVKSRSLILAAAAALLYESFLIEGRTVMRYRLGGIAAAAGAIGLPQFKEYFVSGAKAVQGKAPRLLFLEGGIQLFKDHFPFGTGFGTFGSSTAASHYSSIYYTLGFDSVTGMSPEDPRFLNDTFWPMIFGQLGLAGTVPFVLLLFGVLSMIYAKARACGNRFVRLAAFWYAANVLISSIQSNYPGNNSMVMLTFMVTMMPFAVTAAGSTEADALPEEHNGH